MPSDPRDYKLDLSTHSKPHPAVTTSAIPRQGVDARPFLRAHYTCCNVYQRIYRNADGTLYEGACPRCAKRVRFVVGTGGTNCRAFVIS